MRIACIHIPQFALQCATRIDPSLRGAAVAVVSGVEPGREAAGVLHTPIVLASSRAAWALGVRLGMTAAAARNLSPQIQIVTADPTGERETVRAIADAALALAPVVDIGGRAGAGAAHLAMYAEVPTKTRGSTFGERLLEVLAELGLTARIGIADDRFTAWVAAAHSGPELERGARGATRSDDHGVISVPRGGSAAFLAPRPLSLLAITPEVQHMLEALGVRTLGEFAALPAPSVARPLEADYRALARGESDATLRPYTPEAPIREEVLVSGGNVLELADLLPAGEHAGGLSFAGAISLVATRIARRLAGRGRAAARLDITAIGPGAAREVPVTLHHGAADADEIGHLLSTALDAIASEHATVQDVWRLRVVVAGETLLGSDAAAASEIFAEGTDRFELADARPPMDPPQPDTIDPLAVVLSSSGSLFALSPPTSSISPAMRAERRDAHRRTRRGKQRRSRPTPLAQPRLFDRMSSK